MPFRIGGSAWEGFSPKMGVTDTLLLMNNGESTRLIDTPGPGRWVDYMAFSIGGSALRGPPPSGIAVPCESTDTPLLMGYGVLSTKVLTPKW